MRGILIAGLMATPLLVVQGMLAQVLIEPARITPQLRAVFQVSPVEEALRCEITPVQPALDFQFRFQTGYSINVPMDQYAGPKHGWLIVTRVTRPDSEPPAYLVARVRLPEVPPTNVKVDTFGGFLVGAGRYHVEWAMFDDTGRACRKEWNIEAKLKHGERNVKLDIPPGTVGDFSGKGFPARARARDDAPPLRLTILLHAAPVSPRRTSLRNNDRILLMSTLASLAGSVPALSVRLEVFNLDKQRIVFNQEDFTLESLGRVSQALNDMELDAIDYRTLQKPGGHVDLLSDLINRELASPKPSDAVVFLGPASRYLDAMPSSAVDATATRLRFFYFQYRPLRMRGPMLPDSITHAIERVKGRLIHITSPADFANAIVQLERAAATARLSSPNQ
jgi:hypothetical protein